VGVGSTGQRKEAGTTATSLGQHATRHTENKRSAANTGRVRDQQQTLATAVCTPTVRIHPRCVSAVLSRVSLTCLLLRALLRILAQLPSSAGVPSGSRRGRGRSGRCSSSRSCIRHVCVELCSTAACVLPQCAERDGPQPRDARETLSCCAEQAQQRRDRDSSERGAHGLEQGKRGPWSFLVALPEFHLQCTPSPSVRASVRDCAGLRPLGQAEYATSIRVKHNA
jgi:hypothetical protein